MGYTLENKTKIPGLLNLYSHKETDNKHQRKISGMRNKSEQVRKDETSSIIAPDSVTLNREVVAGIDFFSDKSEYCQARNKKKRVTDSFISWDLEGLTQLSDYTAIQ